MANPPHRRRAVLVPQEARGYSSQDDTPTLEDALAMLQDLRTQVDRLWSSMDSPSNDPRRPPPDEYKDKPWKCDRCGWLIALVDTETGTIRMRQKSSRLLEFTPGTGSEVRCMCNRCLWQNVISG